MPKDTTCLLDAMLSDLVRNMPKMSIFDALWQLEYPCNTGIYFEPPQMKLCFRTKPSPRVFTRKTVFWNQPLPVEPMVMSIDCFFRRCNFVLPLLCKITGSVAQSTLFALVLFIQALLSLHQLQHCCQMWGRKRKMNSPCFILPHISSSLFMFADASRGPDYHCYPEAARA